MSNPFKFYNSSSWSEAIGSICHCEEQSNEAIFWFCLFLLKSMEKKILDVARMTQEVVKLKKDWMFYEQLGSG